MQRRFFLFAICLLLAAAVTSGHLFTSSAQGPILGRGVPGLSARRDKIVVANRASGTISVVDAATGKVSGTYALPAGDRMPEPMYVVYARDRVFVGDRANNRVAVFNPRTFAVEGTVPAGAGIWHMWGDPGDRQLWVNNDIDNTCTVIDPLTLEVLATVPTPADLVRAGGRPHDVVLDPVAGQFAYVSLIGVAGAADYVVKYSTQTFAEVGRAAVGKDPHLSATRQNNLLYVPCQASNALIVLNRDTLEGVTSLTIPGAHGAGMAFDGQTFYTTNFPGGGREALWTIDTRSNTIIGQAVNTPFTGPHNIALTPDRSIFFGNDGDTRKLFVTHSGATNNKVTIYRFNGNTPVYQGEVTVGFNPFGLSYVP